MRTRFRGSAARSTTAAPRRTTRPASGADDNSDANAINSRGAVAGITDVTERLPPDRTFIAGNRFVPVFPHAFLWDKTGAQDLGRPVGFKSCYATAISDSGIVVGYG